MRFLKLGPMYPSGSRTNVGDAVEDDETEDVSVVTKEARCIPVQPQVTDARV